MLIRLSIQNFALIQDICIDFQNGLNVLTGETGAGKSILIDALRLALGERLEGNPVTDKNAACRIEAVFDIPDKKDASAGWLKDFANEEDEYLILRREINPEGRSKAYINRSFVNISDLRRAGNLLLDIHGQFDHQSIFDAAVHVDYVDRLAGLRRGDEDKDLLNRYRELFKKYRGFLASMQELEEKKEGRDRALNLLNYQIEELEKADVQKDEDIELEEERIRLTHAEKIDVILSRILEKLSEKDESASNAMGSAARDMSEWIRIDASASELEKQLESVQLDLEEIIRAVSEYKDKLLFESDRLSQIQERLDVLAMIKKKYGGSIDAALAFFDQAKKERDQLVNGEVYIKDIQSQIKKCLPELKKCAGEISQIRRKAGLELTRAVQKDLKELGMKDARIECKFEMTDFNAQGQDRVELMFCPNPGMPIQPLVEISSGGEASRVMLAIKRALARIDRIPTLIFDEIDTNIGGRLGTVVGEKLKEIASQRQVLLITHLPQIASFAGYHIKVEKSVLNAKTRVSYRVLEGEERVQELAQMMSGERETQISKDHAKEMLKTASKGSA